MNTAAGLSEQLADLFLEDRDRPAVAVDVCGQLVRAQRRDLGEHVGRRCAGRDRRSIGRTPRAGPRSAGERWSDTALDDFRFPGRHR